MSKSYGSFSSNSSIDCLLKKSFDMKYTCTSIKLNKKKYQCSKNYHKWKDIRNVLKHLQLKIFAHCMICKIFFFSRKVLLCHQYNVYLFKWYLFQLQKHHTEESQKSEQRKSASPVPSASWTNWNILLQRETIVHIQIHTHRHWKKKSKNLTWTSELFFNGLKKRSFF